VQRPERGEECKGRPQGEQTVEQKQPADARKAGSQGEDEGATKGGTFAE
jgi:hypothetical protein